MIEGIEGWSNPLQEFFELAGIWLLMPLEELKVMDGVEGRLLPGASKSGYSRAEKGVVPEVEVLEKLVAGVLVDELEEVNWLA